MSWWNIGLGIANALTNAAQVGVSAWQTTEQSKQQEKQLQEQQKQFQTQQQNLKDSQARQDKAESNAIKTAKDFVKDKEKEQDTPLGGSSLTGGLTTTNMPMSRI